MDNWEEGYGLDGLIVEMNVEEMYEKPQTDKFPETWMSGGYYTGATSH